MPTHDIEGLCERLVSIGCELDAALEAAIGKGASDTVSLNGNAVRRAAAELTRLSAENERMREALEPFADIADTIEAVGRMDEDDDRVRVVQVHGCQLAELDESHFLRARNSLPTPPLKG